MGLDIKPGGAHWAYSGFKVFRERLADEFGISLREMVGFGGTKTWPSAEAVPVVPLLNHSDCDGFIGAWDCEDMLPSLRLVQAKWFQADPEDYDAQNMVFLLDGMEHCVEHRCAMVFG